MQNSFFRWWAKKRPICAGLPKCPTGQTQWTRQEWLWKLFASMRSIIWEKKITNHFAPTAAQAFNCIRPLQMTQKQWLECGLAMLQTKWHLIFDGHLLHQVRTCGGLADKTDDFIEKAHQPWKREKERTWGMKNFQQQQLCQLESVRMTNHCLVHGKIEQNWQKRKRKWCETSVLTSENKLTERKKIKEEKQIGCNNQVQVQNVCLSLSAFDADTVCCS